MLFKSPHEAMEYSEMLARSARRVRSEPLAANLVVTAVVISVLFFIALVAPAWWSTSVEDALRNATWCETKTLAERVPCAKQAHETVAVHPAKGATAPVGLSIH